MIQAGILIKRILASAQYRTKILQRKLHSVPQNHGIVLTYHRVLPKKMITKNIEPGMYVTPETFEHHITFLKKHFDIISLNDFYLNFCLGKKRTNNKPLCSITFDDGWIDFYTYVFPVLIKHNIFCSVFLPTSFIGTDKIFWTDRLAVLLNSFNSKINHISCNNQLLNKILNFKGSFELKLRQSIDLLKSFDYNEIEFILTELSAFLGVHKTNHPRSFLNWDEVRNMTKTKLVLIGSHTVNHALLTNLKDKEIIYEIEASKQKLISEGVVDPNFIPFCYPNGNYNQKVIDLVMQADYKLAVSTDCGWIKNKINFFALKRISLHQDVSSTQPLLLYRLLKYMQQGQ